MLALLSVLLFDAKPRPNSGKPPSGTLSPCGAIRMMASAGEVRRVHAAAGTAAVHDSLADHKALLGELYGVMCSSADDVHGTRHSRTRCRSEPSRQEGGSERNWWKRLRCARAWPPLMLEESGRSRVYVRTTALDKSASSRSRGQSSMRGAASVSSVLGGGASSSGGDVFGVSIPTTLLASDSFAGEDGMLLRRMSFMDVLRTDRGSATAALERTAVN